jgi:hypothetical protein
MSHEPADAALYVADETDDRDDSTRSSSRLEESCRWARRSVISCPRRSASPSAPAALSGANATNLALTPARASDQVARPPALIEDFMAAHDGVITMVVLLVLGGTLVGAGSTGRSD